MTDLPPSGHIIYQTAPYRRPNVHRCSLPKEGMPADMPYGVGTIFRCDCGMMWELRKSGYGLAGQWLGWMRLSERQARRVSRRLEKLWLKA